MRNGQVTPSLNADYYDESSREHGGGLILVGVAAMAAVILVAVIWIVGFLTKGA